MCIEEDLPPMMYFISEHIFSNISNILFIFIFDTQISKPTRKCFYSVYIAKVS